MVAPTRNAGLLDHVDYRLVETAAERDEIYRLRYRAYLREGAILPSESQRVSDSYDDAPNAWIFGVYLHGELCSSIRVSVATSEWRMSPSVELFGDLLHPELDKGRIFIDPTRFVADPEKAKRYPELPYATVGWAMSRAFTSTPMSGWHWFVPSIRHFTAGCFCRKAGASRACWTDFSSRSD